LPTLAIVAPLLTDAEAAVRQLTEQRAAAIREREELTQPVIRLQGVIAEADVAQQALAACQAADDRKMDEWLASDELVGPLVPSPATRDAEERLALARSRADAARRALPAAEAAVEGCNLRIGEISRQIAAAISALGLEKLDRFLAGSFAQAVTAAARAETTALALERTMWKRGNTYGAAAVRAITIARAKAGLAHNSRALSDSDAVAAGAAFEKARLAHQPDVAAIERFLSKLVDDPGLEIE
jgi:hypothetical protein